MAWGNLDPNTDEFTKAEMLPGAEDGMSYQKLQALAKNTSYNYRRSDQRLFLFNEQFANLEEKDFDTDFDYDGSYIQTIPRGATTSQTVPFDVDMEDQSVRFMALSTSYVALGNGSYFDIKALATGGFRIKNTRAGAERYLSCSIFELRVV